MTIQGQLTLAIEASNPGPAPDRDTPEPPRVSVCLGSVRGGGRVEVIGFDTVGAASRDDEGLIPAIDRLVRAAGFVPSDLKRVAVSVGPGGFTGLRIATAFVKMVCETTGAECIAVPTARALIRRVDPALRAERWTVILLAWKRHDVWAERYAAGGSSAPTEEGSLRPIRDLGLHGNEVIVCDAALEASMRTLGVIPTGTVAARPRFDAVAVLEASAEITPIDPLMLIPLYPREPEAATKWRELKQKSK